MITLVLNADTSQMSIASLLQQAGGGGVELRDAQGNVVGLVLSLRDHEAWIYAEAFRDLADNSSQLHEAIGRRGGVTTEELLRKAAAARP
jgi:hypothetical protein